MLWQIRLICFELLCLGLFQLSVACDNGDTVWQEWSSCTKSCGGGTQHRHGDSCFWGIDHDEDRKCNEICRHGHPFYNDRCHCPSWRTGTCCEHCRHIYIDNCIGDNKDCGGSPDNIRCTKCYDPYYSGGYGGGCKLCPRISNCIYNRHHCTNIWDTKCQECVTDNIFYKRTNSETKCERMCSFDTHSCWPGNCSDELTSSCKCAAGFYPVKNGTHTICQLLADNTPSILKCHTEIRGLNGEAKQTGAGSCQDLTDLYGNFLPTWLSFKMMSEFTIDSTAWLPRPRYISEENFGVTDTSVSTKRVTIQGKRDLVKIETFSLKTDKSDGTEAKSTVENKNNYTLTDTKYNLSNGQRICIEFEALGGGFLRTHDFNTNTRREPVQYRKTKATETICYTFDNAKPQHCLVDKTCPYSITEPLTVSNRITRTPEIDILFNGWNDPIPEGGNSSHASGIDIYEISVYDVTNGTVSTKNAAFSKTFNSSIVTKNIRFTLPNGDPKLYCVKLGVKDVADNVQQARRFFLFDNSSNISINEDKSFTIYSASSALNFKWQTHHNNICLHWKDHFYNKLYLENSFLDKIKPEPNGQINGIYEQIDGILPVTGTQNIHGITRFYFSSSFNNGQITSEKLVPYFPNQSYCANFSLKDGQTYTLFIKAIDIMNNTFIENRTVHIDRSVPHINNLGLMKNGTKRLYVHNDLDLSKMKLSFDALDPHSGLLNIEWTLRILDSGLVLGSQVNGPTVIDKESCLKDMNNCYCPDVGNCEVFMYNIPLNPLIRNNTNVGKHNRNYFFTVKVTNNAGLSNIEHMDVLVDDSPPEKGVIYEGPIGTPDIDYTSDTSFIVHWHGFIDHESGIIEYRIGLSEICLSKGELLANEEGQNISDYIKVPFTESSARINATFRGKKYVSIIAVNNAMVASDVACSDGIIKDNTPSDFKNVRIENGKWSESIYCKNGQAWLFLSDMKKMSLSNNTVCYSRCITDTAVIDIFSALPVSKSYSYDKNVEEFMCENLPLYDVHNVIYLPDDHVSLSWDLEETQSQIEDYYVGFSLTNGNNTVKSILDYKSTNRMRFFKMRHIGVSIGVEFFAYLRTVNKAKIEKEIEIGPIIIDKTPPIFNEKPTIHLSKDTVTIGWDKNTITDSEQKDPISQIFFQIVHDTNVVSPFFEWQLEDKKPCENFTGGCMTYPLTRLQNVDTDLGLNFEIKMYAYNNAGHVAIGETEPFKIPSRYPPRHAIVKDVDPEYFQIENGRDVNFHFSANKLCSEWNGFKHHEHVVIEIGVGDSNMTANIVPFQPVNDSNFACIESSSLIYNKKYFILLRAFCSGGETISVSNGVRILNETNFKRNFYIDIGQLSPKVKWNERTKNASQVTFCAAKGFKIGQRYKLIFKNVGKNTSVTGNRAVILDRKEDFKHSMAIEVIIVSRKEQCITLKSGALHNVSVFTNYNTAKLTRYIRERNTLPVTWQDEEYNEILCHFTYEVALGERHKPSKGAFKYSLITDWTKSAWLYSHDFHTQQLSHSLKYAVLIKVCTPIRCIGPIISEPFELEYTIEPGRIQTFNMELKSEKSCVEVNLEWERFKAESNVTLYQWSVSKDKEANYVLTRWNSVPSDGNYIYKVTECIKLPVLGHSTLYVCVRAFSTAGNILIKCQNALVIERSEFDRNTLYDIDASVNSWDLIKEMIHSSNIGSNYELLHNAEMDFGNANTTVVGTLMYATERKVTWFLMKNRHLPDFNQCEKDTECVFTIQTEKGFVLFDNMVIKKNTFYYTCAFSNASIVPRELFTETLSEIRVCSNGFIIDDTSPFGGEVIVENTGGFITNQRKIEISWNGFDDNVDTKQLGYIDRIKFYSYAVGTRPDSEDINSYTNVGNTHQAVIRNLDIIDGSVIYASVKATDHAGLSHVVSSNELTIDSSPPVSGKMKIYGNSAYISSTHIEVILIDFKDDQSGIEYFELAVGSDKFLKDVVSGVKYFTDHIQLDLPDNMHDGHEYYVTAKAVNRAGLSSGTVTAFIIPDRSKPTGGHVLDGNWQTDRDQDFQKELGYIQGHWKGFIDPHSGVKYYRVGLGTKQYQDNVEAMIDVGLHTDITWNGTYAAGKKYYLTVEACNGASLCRSVSSDGILLDNSPPIHGIVKVGSSSQHQKYVPTGESVHIAWAGYEDPQSGIDHYEYCLGITPLSCDVSPFLPCLLQSSVVITGLNLIHGNTYYASVKALNKAGMSVTTASDAFTVDTSPPVIFQKPSFTIDNSGMSGLEAQWDRSLLNISWKFIDNESKLSSHIITLKTHHEGHTPIEHVHVGNVDSLTISLSENNTLHNGDKYFVVVTSCNTAGLCSTSRSKDLLIDSSPPHQGGFKPPMAWHNFLDSYNQPRSEINLTWYGFVDAESSIDTYFLSVSRNYSGNELSRGIVSKSVENHLNVQNTSIILSDALLPDELLILTLWARNKAGLNSSVERISVSVLVSNKILLQHASGLLEIQKHSCGVHYCNKDCTCAVLGSPCVDVHMTENCTRLNKTDVETTIFPTVDVFGGLNDNHRNITASSACLSAHWVSHGDQSMIQRYEWSMGIKGQPIGEGVFDLKSERPWKDVGKQVEIVYCLTTKSGLQHDLDYEVSVRAWYAWDTFAVFVSPPVHIDHTPPHHAKGKYIKDSDGTCVLDFDVIDWMDSISVCWDKVFVDTQGRIIYYTMSLGTTINGSDIYDKKNVGLVTNITLSNLKLSHGTRYFFTVTAYNNVGLHATLSSDGFVIDMDTPVTGVVFNTDKHLDSAFQSSKRTFGISWHGFVDHHSGIKSYFVAIVDNDVTNFENITFVDVQLKNNYVHKGIELQHGLYYKGLVKAVDKAGHTTDVVSSRPKYIDVTSPKSFDCESYEHQGISINEKISTTNNTISFSSDISKNDDYIVQGILTGSSDSIEPILSFGRKRITLPIIVNNNNTVEFQYEFVSNYFGTVLFTISGLKSATLGTNYSMDIKMSKCIKNNETTNSKDVTVRQIGQSKLAVKYKIIDEESSINKVKLGMGTSPGGFQILPLTTLHGGSSGYFDVDVRHGSQIYATVMAENHAGLKSIFKSEPIIMDKTPPLIDQLESKLTVDQLEANHSKQTFLLKVKWTVTDQESGVKYCSCRIGQGEHVYSEKIDYYTLSNNNNGCLFKVLDLQHGSIIYVRVKCVNNVEQATELVSEKITVSVDEPDCTFADINFISADKSVYEDLHQNNNNNSDLSDYISCIQTDRSRLLFEWGGFEDQTGINHYEYRLMCYNDTILSWKTNGKHTVAELNDLGLDSGRIYTAEVRALNSGQHTSRPVSANILVQNEEPQLTGKPLSVSKRNEHVVVDWSNVFQLVDDISVTYDVTIGSRSGYSDILELKSTAVNKYDVIIPQTTIISQDIREVFISVMCTYSTGLFTVYNYNYKL